MRMNRIIQGDVIETLRAFPKSMRFDLVIADPPYNIGKDFDSTKDDMPLDEYVAWSEEWIEECRSRLTPNGIMYVYGFPEILARVSARYPIDQQRWLAWHYTNKNGNAKNFWQRSHESIMALWRNGAKKPCLEIDQIREPYTKAYKAAVGKTRKGTRGRFSRNGEATEYKDNGGALPRDVLKFPALSGGAGGKQRWFACRDCGGGARPPKEKKVHKNCDLLQHPTQKPYELTEKLIASRINGKGGKVLIPFAGSGSECLVANRWKGVDWLGIELNPEYVEFAESWIDQCTD